MADNAQRGTSNSDSRDPYRDNCFEREAYRRAP